MTHVHHRRHECNHRQRCAPPTKIANDRLVLAIPTTPALTIELTTTSDMPTGEPQPPTDDYDGVWQVVHRVDDETLWRRIFITPSNTDWRSVLGDQTSAPTKKGQGKW